MKNEVHFYGDDRHFNPKWLLVALAVAVVAAASIFIYKGISDSNEEEPETGQPAGCQPIVIGENVSDSTRSWLHCWLDSCSVIDSSVIIRDSVNFNDIPLWIYLPLNLRPNLEVGYGVIRDTSDIMMCFGAADPGQKDRWIIGHFIARGKEYGRSGPKEGFCAIINDTVTIGRAKYSPFLEQAINDSGYFFRQRALVDSGRMVENHRSGTFFYRALCQAKNHLFVITSSERISILDFAQVLKDIGIEYAITLQSSEVTKGWYREDGKITLMGDWNSLIRPSTANFICWRTKVE